MRFWAAVIVFVLFSLGMVVPYADACTTFWARTPEGALLAKSFDWGTAAGWVVVNERGRARTKLVPGGTADVASWTARYASVSFTTVGPGFPISGMNEAGLAIESLVDLSARPTNVVDPARLTGLELVQFGLDRYESAGDLASFAERGGVSQLGIALHFLACDRRGECVVIEPRDGGARITRGADLRLRALANRPWSDDWKSLEPALFDRLANVFRSRSSSEFRYATVASHLRAQRPRDALDAFGVLASVEDPRLTAWQIVWNLDRGEVRWRERGSERISTLRLADEDTTCRGPSRVRPIGLQAAASAFAPWSASNAVRAENAVVAQLAARGPETRRLAAAVALATQASTCARIE